MRRVLSPDPLTMRPSPSTATDFTTCATHHAAAHQAKSKHDETQDSAKQPTVRVYVHIHQRIQSSKQSFMLVTESFKHDDDDDDDDDDAEKKKKKKKKKKKMMMIMMMMMTTRGR